MELFFKRKYIFEEGEDNENGGATTSSSDNNTNDNGNEDYTVDTNTEDEDNEGEGDNTNNNTEETDNDDNNQDQENPDEDYSVDTETEDDEETGDNNDTGDDGENDTESSSSEENENGPGNNELDKDLFDNLTDDEKERKLSSLKKLYIDLYSKCNTLIEKFNQMSDNDLELQKVSKRILKIIYDLKEYIYYYALNIFDNKSYIENDINFNRYLLILNGIKDAVNDVYKGKKDDMDHR